MQESQLSLYRVSSFVKRIAMEYLSVLSCQIWTVVVCSRLCPQRYYFPWLGVANSYHLPWPRVIDRLHRATALAYKFVDVDSAKLLVEVLCACRPPLREWSGTVSADGSSLFAVLA